MLGFLRWRLREAILVRPLAFIAGGLALAWVTLSLDAVLGPEAIPAALQFPAGNARSLVTTLAGATLTIAGITFWVRAASVQLASAQYSPRVVHGFLQDWFQQSMMGLLVGFFAYMVSLLRVLPDPSAPQGPAADPPHLSILVAIVLAGGSVLAVLVAIRNSVRSMQSGDLARRITDTALDEIRRVYRPGGNEAGTDRDVRHRTPRGKGQTIKAASSGWVQHLDEQALVAALPPAATVRIDIRVGLFVVTGRPLATVWSDAPVSAVTQRRVRKAVELGRRRMGAHEVHDSIQQLVDVALGSLAQVADTASAYEVLVHIDLVLREIAHRQLPPSASVDEAGHLVLRPRAYTFSDYVGEAYDRLRLAAASHPTVAVALMESIGGLANELEESGLHARAAALRRQGGLAADAFRMHDHVEADLQLIADVADRYGLSAQAVA